jgi:hypothetical protein
MKKRSCTLLWLLLLALAVRAQTEASARLDSNLAETGNAFALQLSVPDLLGVTPQEIDFSSWDSIFPAANILAESAWQRANGQHQKTLTLIAFDADTLRLPPLSIRLKGGGKALTNPLELVVTATPAPEDLRDMAEIKDIRREPFSWWAFLYGWRYAIGLGLLFLVVLLLVYQWFRRKKQAAPGRSQSLQMPPHLYALRRLQALEQQQYWQKGQLKPYYAELTHILRQYLEQRYGVAALESVSADTIAQLRHTAFPAEQLQGLQALLEQADLAKFARATPPQSFHPEALQQVRALLVP